MCVCASMCVCVHVCVLYVCVVSVCFFFVIFFRSCLNLHQHWRQVMLMGVLHLPRFSPWSNSAAVCTYQCRHENRARENQRIKPAGEEVGGRMEETCPAPARCSS